MSSWQQESQKKILPPDALEPFVQNLRAQGHTIATLNGSFDLLHAGHLYILYEASKVADILLVAVNSDASVKKYKSASRPIISLPYRIEMLTALYFVDYVTWFEEADPKALLARIRPDVHVNGAEYGEECIEAKTVRAHGGRIHIVPLVPGLSTTQILKKIVHTCA